MRGEQLVKGRQTTRLIFVLHGLHFVEQVRMATHSALTEDHQRAGQDVGTLHRNGHRYAVIGIHQEIARTLLDGTAADNIHGMFNGFTHQLGRMVFSHGCHHRRRTGFQTFGYQLAHGLQCISNTGDIGGSLLYTFKLANFGIELATHTGIGTHETIVVFTAGSRQ